MVRIDVLYVEEKWDTAPSCDGIGFIHDSKIPILFEIVNDSQDFYSNLIHLGCIYNKNTGEITSTKNTGTKYTFKEITPKMLNRYINILCYEILEIDKSEKDKIDPKIRDFIENHLRENKPYPMADEFVPDGVTGETCFRDMYSFFTGNKRLPYLCNGDNFWKDGLDKFVSLIKTQY